MAQYLLAVHDVENGPTPAPEVMQRMFAQVDAYNKELMGAGKWVFAGGLMPLAQAVVVSATDELAVTDGPFAEAKEHLGGFWIIEVGGRDEALEWARRAAAACEAPVEVRAFQAE